MFKFEVLPDGGDKYVVTAEARDVLAWEKASDGMSYTAMVRGGTLVEIYRMAHIASKRQGLFTGSLSEFEKTCDINFLRFLGVEMSPPEPDPTQTEASPGS